MGKGKYFYVHSMAEGDGSMSDRIDVAFRLFDGGFNCAQSVVGAFADQEQVKLALKLAAGFGGGMRCGEVCGAVTGALMVLGLREGTCLADDLDGKRRMGERTLEFMEKFADSKGTLLCRDLLGYDPRDLEAKEKYGGSKREVCQDAIRTAILLLGELGIE